MRRGCVCIHPAHVANLTDICCIACFDSRIEESRVTFFFRRSQFTLGRVLDENESQNMRNIRQTVILIRLKKLEISTTNTYKYMRILFTVKTIQHFTFCLKGACVEHSDIFGIFLIFFLIRAELHNKETTRYK